MCSGLMHCQHRALLLVSEIYNLGYVYSLCKSCKKRFCAIHFHESKHECEDAGAGQPFATSSSGFGTHYQKQASQAARDKAKAAIRDMEQKRLSK